MNIQTMSLIVGGNACNAQCPFCISKCTPSCGTGAKCPPLHVTKLKTCLALAIQNRVTTALLTGKGEPTLYPERIDDYLNIIAGFTSPPFIIPFVELQTNAIRLVNSELDQQLVKWKGLHTIFGITHIIISIVHYDDDRNAEIYQPSTGKMDLIHVIQKLHQIGYTIRLNCMGLKGYIDSVSEIKNLIAFARENKVEQLTFRNIAKPDNAVNEQARWIEKHQLSYDTIKGIDQWVNTRGNKVMPLAHGMDVFDIDGQNFCWGMIGCLTTNKSSDDIRQIIFFQDGRIRYDWKYEGAILV